MPSEIENAGRARREAVLASRATDRAAIIVRGKDRLSWLNGLVTCDLTKLEPPQVSAGAYGLLVEKKGRIQTDFYALPSVAVPSDELALAVLAPAREAMAATLDHYLVMEDAELESPELAFWRLVGPASAKVVEGSSPAYAGVIAALGGAVVAVPATDADAYAVRLAACVAGLSGLVVGDEVWEAVRIEDGVVRFGVEADDTLYPQEASLEKLAVSFDKGCYLGQEVVYMLENRGHVKRKLVPLEVDGDAPLAKGDPVTTAEGAAVGDIRSSVVGPTGRPAAIAMVKWAQAKPGTELLVGARVVRVRASDPA